MSNLDTRKTGGGQTVAFAHVRLESEHLLPEQLVDRVKDVHDDSDVEVHVKGHGTGSQTAPER